MSKTAFEKSPLKSKKFLMWLISTLVTSGIIVMMILKFELNIFACAIIITALLVQGFLSTGAILGQGSLDKFVRLAEISAGQTGKISGVAEKVTTKIKDIAPDVVAVMAEPVEEEKEKVVKEEDGDDDEYGEDEEFDEEEDLE